MSIWKSPVFYFGVFLVFAVVAALAAPFVVPWNNYRADLESYGQKLTGRDVAIGGDIAVRLFPWPRLEAREVEIGNPTGFSDGAFLKADVVRVTLSLGGLFNGSLDVESVDVESPVVNLQRKASGDVNWFFDPKEQVTGQGLLARVKLDQIVVTNGLLSYDDLRNAQSTVFTALNGTLSAQSVLGPWRMKGDAKWHDVALGVTVTTSEKLAGEALKFGVKFTPVDVTFPMASIDGEWTGSALSGAVRIDPQESTEEKTSSEGAFKPLAMQAEVEASTERMSLAKIRIAPADRKDSGTLIEGSAVVEFGTKAHATLELKSPRINMDTLVGATAMQEWRDGGLLQVANQLLANMPARLTADYAVNVSVLTSGGQALNDVRLTGSLQKEAIRVHEFAAELPGRSSGVFDGILFPGEQAAQLGGKFKFESNDTRAFMSWLVPDWRPTIETHWTGSRGRLAVQSGAVDWTHDRFALSDMLFQFDGSPGRASLSSGFGTKPQFNLTVDAGQLDVDSLVPNGWSLLRDGGLPSLQTVMSQDDATNPVEKNLSLRVSSLLLNGVTAQEVAVNVLSHAKGFEVKLLDIGDVGGARLKGGGALTDQGNGPEGALNFKLEAQEPRSFLRLAGLEYGTANWTSALGQTSFDVKITAVPQKSGPELEIVARGSSGAVNAELVVTARELEKGRGMTLTASGGLSSADGAALSRLVGIMPAVAVGPGDVTFELKGSIADSFVFSVAAKALDVAAELSGTADVKQPYLGVSGKFSARSKDGLAVVKAIGIPVESQVAQPFDVAGIVAAKDGGLSLLDLQGNLIGRRMSAQATLSAEGRVEADIETDTIDIKEALALALMPWEGPVVDLASGFAEFEGNTITGEVFFKPLQFDPLSAGPREEVVVGIGFGGNERLLSISSQGEKGLKAEVSLVSRGASYDLSGNVRWPVELSSAIATAENVRLAEGEVMLDGEFKASGRSPAAALASLEGKGHYWLTDAALPLLTLDGFAGSVLAASTPEALTAALAKLETSPGTPIGQRIGNFDVSNGGAQFSAIAPVANGVVASIAPQVDLTSRQINLVTTIALADRPELPPVAITYSGTPGAMDVRNGTSALAAKLGYDLLSKEMAELERLQQEQQALLVKEEAQRREDEKRFADYQSTRLELRMQTRNRRFHAAMREKQAAVLAGIVAAAIKNGPARTEAELAQQKRRREVWRGAVQR